MSDKIMLLAAIAIAAIYTAILLYFIFVIIPVNDEQQKEKREAAQYEDIDSLFEDALRGESGKSN